MHIKLYQLYLKKFVGQNEASKAIVDQFWSMIVNFMKIRNQSDRLGKNRNSRTFDRYSTLGEQSFYTMMLLGSVNSNVTKCG